MPDWQEILSRDGPPAWRAAYRITGNRADADECLQEAFLGALGSCAGLSLRHWVDALLRPPGDSPRRGPPPRAPTRAERGMWRIGTRSQPPRRAEHPGTSKRPSSPIGCCLCWPRSLRGKPRSFACIAWRDFSYEEIAQQLAVSVAAVGVHLHRARERLRELLSSSLDAPRDPRAGAEDLSRSPS